MTPQFSAYLDLLRLLAALAVLLSHANSRALIDHSILPQSFGHNAVVVFFLLSGYVIAYVADVKEKTASSYWVSRFARIYSVALPALALTLLCDLVGAALNPGFYAGNLTTHDHWLLRLAASLSFSNELWFVSIMPFSNSPYWSLCYEMSYYLLFSIWAYAPAARRGLYLMLAALLIGPKILILAPIWALGVVLYRWRAAQALASAPGALLWLASVAGIVAFQTLDLSKSLSAWTAAQLSPWLYLNLNFSKHFLGDYLLALLIAANFIGFRALVRDGASGLGALMQRLHKPIALAAGFTFSIYLFHLPLLHFFTAVLEGSTAGYGRYLTVVGLALAASVLLGSVTETQKTPLKRWLERQLLPRLQRWRG
ncbi:acyltransferase [Paucibacter sp. APW11]|uniref:Acyltransferase n=1 Tax=Roseateles aquae TaxID=3077235 RepID=A0ABU3P967_9BURK|nr:acyltransferase [Paucibacter sp. APW11]MDT8999043.1 acyltransferase [Paucibacter sp. APW11]